MLCYVIERRNETLVRYTDEIMKLKDAIMDMELEIQRSNEVIRALRDRQDDGGGRTGGKDGTAKVFFMNNIIN